MNDILFFILLTLFVVILIKKESISLWLFDTIGVHFQPKTILYASIISIALLMTYGILSADTKKKYSNISEGYNKMRPNAPTNESKNKPHRFFDVDFDSLFPW